MLGQMKPLFSMSFNCALSSFNSTGAMEIGSISGSSSIAKSIAREEGIPGRSSRKRSENSFTTGTVSRIFSFPLTSMTHANIAQPPC